MINNSLRFLYRILVRIPVLGFLSRKLIQICRAQDIPKDFVQVPTKILIYTSNFMTISEEQPLVIDLISYLKERELYLLKFKRIVILVTESSFSQELLQQIIENDSPIVSHVIVGSLFEIDRYLKTFLTEFEIMHVISKIGR